MAEYKVKLIMSEQYIINAESKDEAEQKAREKLGCDYLIDNVEIKTTDEQCEITDMCEWIKYDYRTIVPKNHDADNPYWRIPENMDKLKYCPYCGKEIVIK